MKIVFLSFYSGYVHRGMETVVHELATRLAKHHEVTVFQAGPNTGKKPYAVTVLPQKMKWPKVDDSGISRKVMVDYYYRKIALFSLQSSKEIIRLRPDIVFPVNGGWQTHLMKLYTRLYGGKLVIAGQAGLGWDDRWNLLTRPDLFIALSKRNARWAKQYAGNTVIKIIPNGVDLNRFKPSGDRIEIRLPKPVILCVAGNQPYKRVKNTINAVYKIPKGSLLLARGGEVVGDDEADYGKRVLKDRFFCGYYKHSQMPEVYRAASLFTLVSESSEAFGVAYLEAMATNLPVVATDDELRHEIIGDAGLYVSHPEDTETYARILQNALEKKWGTTPRKQAEKFSWEKIAEKYEKEFKQLLNI